MLADRMLSLFRPRADIDGGVTDWRGSGNGKYQIQHMPWQYLAGVQVTYEEAVSLSAVWACADVITRALSCSSWDVYTKGANKSRTYHYDDPLDWVLNARANRDMTAIAWKESMYFSAILCGGGFSEIVMDGGGRVSELWPLPYDSVTPHPDANGYMEYRYKPEGRTDYRVIPAKRMVHLRGPSLSGYLGQNMIARMARTLGIAIAAEKFTASYFENGTEIGGVLEYPGKLGDPDYQAIVQSWRARYQGPGKAHQPAILEEGMKYSALTPDASKAQLIESKQFLIEEIARFFGVSPHKIGHLLRSTFNNIEHLGIEFVRDCLTPWAVRAEEELDYKLFSVRSPKRIEIDTKWLEFGDAASRVAYHTGMRRLGAENANEIRASEGLNSIGPQGDVYVIESNMQRLDMVGTMTPPGGSPPRDDIAKKAIAAMFASALSRHKRRLDNRRADLKTGNLPESRIVKAIQLEGEKSRPKLIDECQAGINLLAMLGGPCLQFSKRLILAAGLVEGGQEAGIIAENLVNEMLTNAEV